MNPTRGCTAHSLYSVHLSRREGVFTLYSDSAPVWVCHQRQLHLFVNMIIKQPFIYIICKSDSGLYSTLRPFWNYASSWFHRDQTDKIGPTYQRPLGWSWRIVNNDVCRRLIHNDRGQRQRYKNTDKMILMINSIITIEIVPDHNLGINTLSVLGSETLLASNLFLQKI